MIDLLSYLGDPEGGERRLKEIRTSVKPATVLLFTSTGETIDLHWEEDGTVRSFVVCPGTGCPACLLAEKPQSFSLLPVLDLATGQVGVLRISAARGPGSLAGQLAQVLRRTDLTDVAARITRESSTYTVTPCALNEHADRGQAAIQKFLADKPSLSSAFTAMTPEEMREIPRIHKLLDSINLNATVRPVAPKPAAPTPGAPKPPQPGT